MRKEDLKILTRKQLEDLVWEIQLENEELLYEKRVAEDVINNMIDFDIKRMNDRILQ